LPTNCNIRIKHFEDKRMEYSEGKYKSYKKRGSYIAIGVKEYTHMIFLQQDLLDVLSLYYK